MKDDAISKSLKLVTVKKSSETAHAGRNLPVKEFCYLRTVNPDSRRVLKCLWKEGGYQLLRFDHTTTAR